MYLFEYEVHCVQWGVAFPAGELEGGEAVWGENCQPVERDMFDCFGQCRQEGDHPVCFGYRIVWFVWFGYHHREYPFQDGRERATA